MNMNIKSINYIHEYNEYSLWPILNEMYLCNCIDIHRHAILYKMPLPSAPGQDGCPCMAISGLAVTYSLVQAPT